MFNHATRVSTVALAVFAMLAVGCEFKSPASPAPPQTPELFLHGTVAAAEANGPRSPLSGATVSVHCDRNADGKIDPHERAVATTDPQGAYSLRFPVRGSERAVLAASHPLTAKSLRTFMVGSGAEMALDIDLVPVQPLACESGMCVSNDGRLRVIGLPANVLARGRSFDPTIEKAFFPGPFSDSAGKLLVSGAFSSVELVDQTGQPVTSLAAPVELRMPLPRTTWSVVTDIRPNSGKIEYPLYSFDEVSGEWVRDGEGVLEGDPGDPIPEASLDAIRAGSFVREISAVAQVTHFTFWNVDWPIGTYGCVAGIVVDEDDKPLAGSTIVANGLSYTGSSMPRVTGVDGRFCTEAMRSEGPGEDVDLDGRTGEIQKVAVVATRGGTAAVSTAEMPRQHGECGGTCIDLGRIRLATRSGSVARCRVKGRAVDAAGLPVAASVSVGFDPAAPILSGPSGAAASAPAAAMLPMGVRLVRGGMAMPRPGQSGFARADCSTSGGQIGWPADRRIARILVAGANGLPRWLVESSKGGLESPIMYGRLPPDAVQRVPETGRPNRLAKGDVIRLEYVDGTREMLTVQ